MSQWGARIDGEVYGRPGDAPWDSVTWDIFEQHTGKKVTFVHWGQPFGSFDLNAANLANARGATNLISVDGNKLTEIAEGKLDSVIQTFAEKCHQFGGVLWLRPFWEMNGAWYSWGRHPDFIVAWQRYVDIIRAHTANVKFVWCINTVWDKASSELNRWWPGSAYVDAIGIDGYNRNEPWKWPAEVFQPTMNVIKELDPDLPWMICETGCTEAGGSKATWIAKFLNWLPKHTRIFAFVWFNWNELESGKRRDWQIESSSSAQAAFKKGISKSYYS